MNAPNRFELHVLGEGEQKLTVEEDTKIPNAATITINKEDHTLAGMLRSQLLLLPHVLFAGYKVPHPLEPRFIIKIQTDSESTPIQAVQEACKGLILTLTKMREALQEGFAEARALGGAADMLAGFAAPEGTAREGGGGVGNDGINGDALFGTGNAGEAPSGFGEFIP